MPIQLYDLDIPDYWSEDVKPSVIDDLEFYCGSPVAPQPTSSAMTVPAAATTAGVAVPPSADLWKTFEMDEDPFVSMSPPDPSGFDELLVDLEEADDSADPLMSASIFGSGVLFQDCMWAGQGAGNDHEVRTLSRQSSSSSSSDSVNSSSRGSGSSISISSGGSSSSSKTNDHVSIESCRTATTISTSCSSVNSSSLNNGCINRTGKSMPLLQNVVSSNISSSSSSQMAAASGTSVVKTIEVPTGSGGPVRKTGVIVQKTFGRSLLIKSRTKCENNNASLISANSSNSSTSSSGNSLLKVKPANPSSHVTLSSSSSCSNNNNSSSFNNVITNNNANSVQTAGPVAAFVSPPPTIVSPPPTIVSSSRPETPQSLSESEDDTCQLDLNSVLYNLDNLKPPQGDLWDEVLAAVEQEQANGIEIPPAPIMCIIDDIIKPEPEVEVEVEAEIEVKEEPEEYEEDDLSDSSSAQLDSGSDDLPPSPATTANSSPAKAFPSAGKGFDRNAVTTVVSDHSYDKRAWIRLEDLGVQTPSDSEDDVDVVSLYEKSGSSSRSSSRCSSSGPLGLPNNPSAKDQEEIQVITTSKLLSASKAVSKRLKTKISRGKTFLKNGKRRLSESDEYKSMKLNKRARVHHYRPTKSRFATDSESDSKEKRDMHNNMERMRRIDLRNSFEELKALVPSLANKERAPKVLILQDAAGYCTDLKIQSRQLAVQVAALRKEQERLRATVSGLRRSLAAHR